MSVRTNDLGVVVDRDASVRVWIRSGQLEKRASSATYSALIGDRWRWQRRWFVLLPSSLQYYRGMETRARGLLDLQRIDDICQIVIDDDLAPMSVVASSPYMQIGYGARRFVLRAHTADEAVAWVCDIITCKNRSRLWPSMAIINDSDHDKPWRIRSYPDQGPAVTITADDLSSTASCQSGDLLLFRTSGVRGGLVRNATSGAYDHVGLVLRLRSGKIGVLEALGDSGVHVVAFDAFIREQWYQQYSMICIRHLESPVTQRSSRALAAFCRRSIGRRYSWKPAAHVLHRHQTGDDEPETYFCSELLASAYKAMGYLRPDLPASRYTPAMFAYAYNLQLLENRLSPEIRLAFPS